MQRIGWKDQRAIGDYPRGGYRNQAKALTLQSFHMLIGW